MKKTIIVASLLLGFLMGKSQQNQPPSMEEHLKRAQELMQKELQLNATQQQQLMDAYKEFLTSAHQLHTQFPPPPPPPPPPADPKFKEAMDKLIAARDAKVKTALNSDQYKKYLEVEKTLRPPHPGPGHNMPPPPPPPIPIKEQL